jgi:hypothetical protein
MESAPAALVVAAGQAALETGPETAAVAAAAGPAARE